MLPVAGSLAGSAPCVALGWERRRLFRKRTTTKRPFISPSNPKATPKPQPRNVRWKFVRPSPSATTASEDRHRYGGGLHTRETPPPPRRKQTKVIQRGSRKKKARPPSDSPRVGV